jgi:hypothetical protein
MATIESKKISELREGDYDSHKDNAWLPASFEKETFKYPLAAIENAVKKLSSKLFPYNAKTTCLRIAPGGQDTFNLFVKSAGFFHNFFISFDGTGNTNYSEPVSSFRLTGSNLNDWLNNKEIYFAQYNGSIYLVLSTSYECELFWDNPRLEPSVLPANFSPARKWERLRFGFQYSKDENYNIIGIVTASSGIGTEEVTSDRAYIARGAKLIMLGYGEMRASEGFIFDMHYNVAFKMFSGCHFEMRNYAGFSMVNSCRFEMNDKAGFKMNGSSLVDIRQGGGLEIENSKISAMNGGGIAARDHANMLVQNNASIQVTDDANINIFNHSSLCIDKWAHITVEGSSDKAGSGLDVLDNSDVYIGSNVNIGKSKRKLWVVDESCLLMCESYHFGLLQDMGQQAKRLLAVLDEASAVLRGAARLEMNGLGSISVKNCASLEMDYSGTLKVNDGASLEMKHSGSISVSDTASITAGRDSNVLMLGDSVHTAHAFRNPEFFWPYTKIKLTGDYSFADAWFDPPAIDDKKVDVQIFLGNEYKFWNAKKDGTNAKLTYSVCSAGEVAQKTTTIADNRYVKIMLVEIIEKTEDGRTFYKPIFAEEADNSKQLILKPDLKEEI